MTLQLQSRFPVWPVAEQESLKRADHDRKRWKLDKEVVWYSFTTLEDEVGGYIEYLHSQKAITEEELYRIKWTLRNSGTAAAADIFLEFLSQKPLVTVEVYYRALKRFQPDTALELDDFCLNHTTWFSGIGALIFSTKKHVKNLLKLMLVESEDEFEEDETYNFIMANQNEKQENSKEAFHSEATAPRQTVKIAGCQVKLVNVLPARLRCTMCSCALQEPVQVVKCSHRYCADCWIFLRRYPNSKCTIESCEIELQGQKFKTDRVCQMEVQRQKIFCPNAHLGCTWIGCLKYNDIKNHIQEECLMETVPCQYYPVCIWKGFRWEQRQHDITYAGVHYQESIRALKGLSAPITVAHKQAFLIFRKNYKVVVAVLLLVLLLCFVNFIASLGR